MDPIILMGDIPASYVSLPEGNWIFLGVKFPLIFFWGEGGTLQNSRMNTGRKI